MMLDFKTDIFKLFDRKSALLTVGDLDEFTTMPVKWGTIGMVWDKPVVTVFVGPSQYIYREMDWTDYFTLSFYPEEYKEILASIGPENGSDEKALRALGLSTMEACESVSFYDADVTFLCRKTFQQRLGQASAASSAPIVRSYHLGEKGYDMFIGEVVVIFRSQSKKDEII